MVAARKSSWSEKQAEKLRALPPVVTMLESLEKHKIRASIFDRVRVEPTEESFREAAGRPEVSPAIRALILKMAAANPLGGAHPASTASCSRLTLLGLIIGFSFSMASSRYEQRKALEEGEANAIGTKYVRADFLPDATGVRTPAEELSRSASLVL